MLVHHDALAKDLKAVAASMAEFVGVPSTQSLKHDNATLLVNDEHDASVFRKDVDISNMFTAQMENGRWLRALSTEQLIAYDILMSERVSAGAALWLETGKLPRRA